MHSKLVNLENKNETKYYIDTYFFVWENNGGDITMMNCVRMMSMLSTSKEHRGVLKTCSVMLRKMIYLICDTRIEHIPQ